MGKPKRHHWWPMVQSRYWTDTEGLISVTRHDGTSFRANPLNIGVESELYTRFGEDDSKDTAIEEWFAETIDAPAAMIMNHLLDPDNVRRRTFRGGDPEKAKTARELGFRINPYIDSISLPGDVRHSIARYLAALLVRHPTYLAKLVRFHEGRAVSGMDARNLALDTMLRLYDLYTDRIGKSVIMVTRRVGTAEYLYADGGVSVEEPWNPLGAIPFDMHAPLTPDIALQVFPIPNSNDLGIAMIGEATNQGVARQNRIIIGRAMRFVFSRQAPPAKFIRENFGVPAPKNIGTQIINGRLNTTYDPARTQ